MLERNKLTTRFVVGLPPSGPLTFDSWLFGPFCVLRLRVRLLSGRTPPDMGHLTEIENLSTTGNNEILVPPASWNLYPIYVKSLKIKPLQIPNNFLVFYATHLQFLRNTYSCFYI
jgi:hypothetical protein